MTQNPCSVCGGKDVNLIDGFYYCVECGTQDINAQETVVEHTVLADGTFAHAASRKITKVLKDAIEMSGEWHKWHAFNFIIAGLTDEMMALGASTSFREKVLWIWTRYMKKFVDQDKMGTLEEVKQKQGKDSNKSIFEVEEDNRPVVIEEEEAEVEEHLKAKKEKEKKIIEQLKNSLKIISKGIILAIFYLALNLDKSDIQLSHIFRFIREGRLSIANCTKFVPSELDLKSIPNWKNFINCHKEYAAYNIRQIAMSLIKVLDLGKPVVPNVRKIVDNYVIELCLPNDFKNVVFSLMHQAPCDYLDIDVNFTKKYIVRIPDYEGVIMSYVLVALKMTFGLDDDYEITLSNSIDKINDEDCKLKSYKLGNYSQPTDRLFSFREWSQYLQFRKTILCKYYLPMARQHNLDVEDTVFIEHLEERNKRKVLLSDEVTMDILNKIEPTNEVSASVIPKSEFTPTLTPMTDFTEVILHYIQDPDVKLLISEDFTQYSLKYTCEDFKWLKRDNNLTLGVSEDNKIIKKYIGENLMSKESDFSMVYVRNCENKNWLKTNPPGLDHVTKIDTDEVERNSDHGYDSNVENTSVESEFTKNFEDDAEPQKLESIEEEKEGVSIFDDNFDDIIDTEIKEEIDGDIDTQANCFEFNNEEELEEPGETSERVYDEVNLKEVEFDPATFDRQETIKELVLAACKKYKIPIPQEYNTRAPQKRKSTLILNESGAMVPKRRKIIQSKRGEAQKEMNEILSAYYETVEKDLLSKVSQHLESFVKDFVDLDQENITNGVNVENCDNSFADEEYRDLNAQNIDENKDETFTEPDNLNKTVDSSVVEVETEEGTSTDDLLKLNPKFDEKTHDIKQLYIKYSEGLRFENLCDNDDLDIDKILDKKILESKLNEPITLCAKDLKKKLKVVVESDSEDELEKEKDFLEAKRRQKELKLEPLVQNADDVKEFNYWFRHYPRSCMSKTINVRQKFNMELKECFPKSFTFVIQECASILDCTAFSLYKQMQELEQALVK